MQKDMKIVVGYDGSDQSLQAVRWAASQAATEQRSLHLVHAWLWPLFTNDLGPVKGVADSGLRHSAEAIAAEGLAAAREVSPSLDAEGGLVVGSGYDALRKLSSSARMVVVGSRGLGGFLGLLVGSVSLQLAATAQSPVVIVRSAVTDHGPVVVGVDGSGPSIKALDDACEMAQLWGASLTIVHARKDPRLFGSGKRIPQLETEAKTVLDDAVKYVSEKAPEITIRQESVAGRSIAEGLLKAAEGSRILIVGAKGRGNVGSTAHAILHHAKSDVMISKHKAE